MSLYSKIMGAKESYTARKDPLSYVAPYQEAVELQDEYNSLPDNVLGVCDRFENYIMLNYKTLEKGYERLKTWIHEIRHSNQPSYNTRLAQETDARVHTST